MSHLHHKVSALIDGELQGRARKRAIAHARACAVCQQELEQTYALKQRLLGLAAAEPPADLFATLGAVRPAPTSGGVTSSPWTTVAARRALVGAGSVSLAVLTLAYAVGAPQEPEHQVAPPIEEFSAEFAGSTGAAGLSDPAVEAIATKVTTTRNSSRSGPPFAAQVGRSLTATGSHGATGDDRRAVRLLHQAATAPARVAYSGTRRVSWFGPQGESSVTLEVEHSPRQGTSFATSDPDSPTATFVAARESSGASGLGGQPVDLLIDSYDVAVVGHDNLAGRQATVISASRDGDVTANFWIDDASGMLLRRELYDGGALVRSSDLTSLQTTRKGFIPHLPPEFEAPSATPVSTEFAATLTDKGWACPQTLPSDFHLTLLHRLDGKRDVMHAAYSDGLSTVSVFEEHGQLDDAALPGFDRITSDGGSIWVKEGLPTMAVWQSGSTIYTVLTDAPPSTTADLVAALPHTAPPESSSVSRLGRGLSRVGSFLHLAG